jgi:Protein of unknown function (DUF2009)
VLRSTAGAKEVEANELKNKARLRSPPVWLSISVCLTPRRTLCEQQVLQLAPAVEGQPEFVSLLAHLHSQLVGAAAEAAALARTHRDEAVKLVAPPAGSSGLSTNSSDAVMVDAAGEEAALDAAAAAAAALSVDHGLATTATWTATSDSYAERAKSIPMRLTLKERQRLRLLEAALNVSEYTDKVDILCFAKSKAKRIHSQLVELCSILCGLVMAVDYKAGVELVQDKDFDLNAQFFQIVFEIGRRHKICNPDKMRGEYGKLVHLLMDSTLPEVRELLGFDMVCPLKTVYSVLEHAGATDVLSDQLLPVAVREIDATGKNRAQVASEIRSKERAREHLAKRYSNEKITSDELLSCLYSIGDNESYLRFNRDPIDRMIGFLTTWYEPRHPPASDPLSSLAISLGAGGARLSHSHERQYAYVLQSLTLWRHIAHDMFKLWCCAEGDLLRAGNTYRLTDTGQGLNRVQQAPQVSKAVHSILGQCQSSLGSSWVGSSVVHLGDHNVPNALAFIDKYTQVPRILGPIVLTIDAIDTVLMRDPGTAAYVNSQFGGARQAQKAILSDFFRHGFDGSGADNFFDAGSCIDGRLTSAWNWCSNIEKKSYWPLFKLCGFQGFDGDFGEK